MSTPGPSAWKYPMSIAMPIQLYVGCHAPNRTPNSVEEVRSIEAAADVVPEDVLSETLTSALQFPAAPRYRSTNPSDPALDRRGGSGGRRKGSIILP